MRADMESKRRSIINREVNELTLSYENQLKLLECQLQKEREMCMNRVEECGQLREQV